MGLNVGKGWRGESQRHSLARKGIKTGRTPTTPMLSPRVSGYAKRFNKGVEIESKEHPKLSKTAVEGLVRDHLNENPNYYKKNPKLSDKQLVKQQHKAEIVKREKRVNKLTESIRRSRLKADSITDWAIINSKQETLDKEKLQLLRLKRERAYNRLIVTNLPSGNEYVLFGKDRVDYKVGKLNLTKAKKFRDNRSYMSPKLPTSRFDVAKKEFRRGTVK